MSSLLAPYQLLQPLVSPLLITLALLLAVALALAVWQRRIAEACAIAGASLFLFLRWQWPLESPEALPWSAMAALLSLAGLVGIARKRGAEPGLPPVWIGLAVIALAFAVKCVALAEFPAHLNAYSAETGVRGVMALDGHWPGEFLAGKEYDLVNGGLSPLFLPMMWGSMAAFGGNIFALRLAEVLASSVLLLLLWIWLRRRFAGWWAVGALAAFALSPWHLAQSRMGTFFSISAALAMALLVMAERLSPGRPGGALWRWGLFGLVGGAIGYAYAPVNVLYAFVALVVALAVQSGERAGALLAVGLFTVVLLVQLGWPPNPGRFVRSEFGALATDASIFRKTPQGVVTKVRQPLKVVVGNATDNLVTWWQRSWQERDILVWYAPALLLLLGLALVALFDPRWRIAGLYVLIGALPPLLVFPVQRRTIVLWPLVYCAGVWAVRELSEACAGLSAQRWWRGAVRVVAVTSVVFASLHGLAVYATTNSIVRTGTYFGPDHRLEMMREAERLLGRCEVWFVNPTFEEEFVARLRLYEPARKRGGLFHFVTLRDAVLDPRPAREVANCFLHLEHGDQPSAIMDELAAILPNGMLTRRRSSGEFTLQYSVYQLPPDV